MKKGIKEVLQTEMLDFTAPLLINNLPSIDGLLVSQREVIWGMYKAGMKSTGNFYKMLKATGKIFDYYVLGDMPLCGVMKNMGNNYILHKYLMPKGSFGNKNLREGEGASPRYIECKLDKYSETMLQGINKNSVNLKWNYDATEKEPVILPSVIPNILTNLRMSISVSEANRMPSHNLADVCDCISAYIDSNDIDKAIEILKCPDLPSYGSIIYNKGTFDTIYKTGRGSFINIGKYKYNEKENKITIYEIPYSTYVENIYDEIEKNFDKFENEVEDFHNGTDRNGVSLELDLKKGVNEKIVIQKLRKYTSFESTFSCNFTILDLDGKTPKQMSLQDIINKWITHRITCIKNETNYDLNHINNELYLLYGLKSILPHIDDVIKIIRGSKNKNEAITLICDKYKLDEEQSKYVVSIQLINLTKDYIKNKLENIKILENDKKEKEEFITNERAIKDKIKEQLLEVKKSFGSPRRTEIIYDDELANVDISEAEIEDYNCRILVTSSFIKKHLKQSDNHKVEENNKVYYEMISTNKSTLIAFTNKGNRYKISCNDLKVVQPSAYGQSLKQVFNIPNNEEVVKVVSIEGNKGYMFFVFKNGKIAKVDVDSYLSNYKVLKNAYSLESPIIDIYYSPKDIDILLISDEGKGLIINTEEVNSKKSKNANGISCMKLYDNVYVNSCMFNIKGNEYIRLNTINGKSKEIILDDCIGDNTDRSVYNYIKGRKNNTGNFLLNCRPTNDKIKNVEIVK